MFILFILGKNDHVSYKAGLLAGSALWSLIVCLCLPVDGGAVFSRCHWRADLFMSLSYVPHWILHLISRLKAKGS